MNINDDGHSGSKASQNLELGTTTDSKTRHKSFRLLAVSESAHDTVMRYPRYPEIGVLIGETARCLSLPSGTQRCIPT